jgi:hypothetical protein
MFIWKICSDVTCGPISHGEDLCSIPDRVEFTVDKPTGFSPNTLAALNGSPCRRNYTVCLFCLTWHFSWVAMTTKGPAVATLRLGQRSALATEFVAQTFNADFSLQTVCFGVYICLFCAFLLVNCITHGSSSHVRMSKVVSVDNQGEIL